MTDKRRIEALQDLCEAVSKFGEVSLADLDKSVIFGIEEAINERQGTLVTQVESSYKQPLRVTILLSHVIDGARRLVPLCVVEDVPQTLQ